MLLKTIIPGTALVFLIASCGSNKKLTAATDQINSMQTQINNLNKTNADLKGQVASAQDDTKAMEDKYNSCQSSARANERKLQQVQSVLDDQAKNLHAVQQKLDEALVNFESKGVEVYYKDGLVHVDMSDNLLYKTGSSKLSDSGKEALSALASVLNDYPNLKVIVLGNTDDVKFKKGSTDNWSLSTERANGVVRTLKDAYNVDPARLTAAGKGKYAPIADNSTAEGRAKNRRTDIILNPDLARLWNSVDHE